MTPSTLAESAGRHELPEVMLPGDVREALGLKTDSAARRAIRRGDAGPFVRRGRTYLVLRASFLAHLAAQQVHVAPPAPPPVPTPPPWAADLLRRGRRAAPLPARRGGGR